MAQAEEKLFSAEEYLMMEKSAEHKSEFFRGELFAMTGASFRHNLIAWNIGAGLHRKLHDSDCFAFMGDMKIEVEEAAHYTYPDVSIVCGDMEFVRGRDDILRNPVAIIEILSKSTRDYDRGSKFTAYRNIPSLRDYILIDQYECHAECFHKNDSGFWVLKEFRDMGDVLEIESLDVELALAEIYHRVTFATEDQ